MNTYDITDPCTVRTATGIHDRLRAAEASRIARTARSVARRPRGVADLGRRRLRRRWMPILLRRSFS